MNTNKQKNFNDPVYGFVTIPYPLLFDIIEHPRFQRLRRIKQLGLTNMVYPGAHHTRFQHVIGAMSLTQQALETLEQKGIEITRKEKEAVLAAILLHDIGHGPYSHTLEGYIISDVPHEQISLHFMNLLNAEFGGKLDKCIEIFTNKYSKKFLHQLVSSQLDMDRLDYLRRDSFYSGVQEGVVGQDRIINMLNVVNDELVVDEKGIYSIEKFLIARRLMYWQVYLHKTVVCAEQVLIKIMQRAKLLSLADEKLFATPALAFFLENNITDKTFFNNTEAINYYAMLDDFDVFTSVKVWCNHHDKILSNLCKSLINRQLPKIIFFNNRVEPKIIEELNRELIEKNEVDAENLHYFIFTDSVKNKAYSLEKFNIKIHYKNGKTEDIAKASDQYNIEALAKPVTKYFLCFPKNLNLPALNK
ncbi:MAG: HD domain-containing protein [Bacteroidia bacterium]